MSLLEKMNRNSAIIKKLDEINFELYEEESIEDREVLLASTTHKDCDELRLEIATINNLISIAESITKNKKGEKLKEIITRINKIKNNTKILIFTQFRATQNYLNNLLSNFSVEIFHGSLDRHQKEKAITNFKNKANILISTEAGGEGRNLQFCNILINYDLPWSPLKIEQRIGRLHRFGQLNTVIIHHLLVAKTMDEKLMTALKRKFTNQKELLDYLKGVRH